MASVIAYLVLSVFLVCCDCSPIKRSTTVQDDDCYGTECYYSDLDTTNEIVLPENLTEVVLVNLPLISHNQGEIVNILERLSTQTVNQDQTVILDLIATLLNNITESLNTMITKHGHMEKLLLDKNHLSSSTNNRLASLPTLTPNGKTIPSTPENHKATPDQITMQSQVNQDEMTPSINHQQESMTTMTADILRDCTDVALHSSLSKPYRITPNDASRSYTLRCDLETDGGGWTVIQRRLDGSVDFYRDWQDYVDGFGDPYGEYWAGLEFIYLLTKTGTWELRVDLEDFHGNTAYAHYTSFRVGDAASMYRLSYGTYSGTAGNGMEWDNNDQFSTRDNDNDASLGSHCAEKHKGGWWYSDCSTANLNGKYLGPNQVNEEGLTWYIWRSFVVLKKSEMKIRSI